MSTISEWLAHSRLILAFTELMTKEKMSPSSLIRTEDYSKHILLIGINQSFQTGSAFSKIQLWPSSEFYISYFSYCFSLLISHSHPNPIKSKRMTLNEGFQLQYRISQNLTYFYEMWDNLQLRAVWHLGLLGDPDS